MAQPASFMKADTKEPSALVPLDPERYRRLASLLELSREMRETARQKQWQALIDLEATQRHLLKEFSSTAPAREEAETLAAAFREMLDINNEVSALAGVARGELAVELHKLSHGRQALQAYKSGLRT